MDQGKTLGPQEDNNGSQPFFDDNFFDKQNKQYTHQSLTLEESLRLLLSNVREYYQVKKWDFNFISKSLNNALNAACDKELLSILQTSTDQAMMAGSDLKSALLSFKVLHTNCSQANTGVIGFDHQHVMAVAEMRDFMLGRNANLKAVNLVLVDCIKLIRNGLNGEELGLYINVLKAEAASDLSCEPYIDLFGDITKSFEFLHSSQILPKEVSALNKEVRGCVDEGRSVLRVLEKAVGVVRAVHLKFSEEDRSEVDDRIHDFITAAGFLSLDSYVDCLVNLRANKASIFLEEFFHTAAVFLLPKEKEEPLKDLYKVCKDLAQTQPHPQLLVNLTSSIKLGHFTAVDELLKKTNLLAADAHAIRLLTTDIYTETQRHHHLMTKYIKAALGLKNERYENELSALEQSVYLRAKDLHHGFSADLFPCKRTPSREPPELVRFGRDIAEVKYINAKTPAEFPGRGFLIKKFRLDDVFARDEVGEAAGDTPFKAYLEAWPKLAPQFRQFDKAEVLYTRGMKIISCRSKDDYNITFSDGTNEQVSIVVFNDHFKNETSKGVYLIPTAILAHLLSGTFIGSDDYRGFEPTRPDLNNLIKSPKDLIEHPLCKDKVIRLDDPQSLLYGFRGLMNGVSGDLDKIARHNSLISQYDILNSEHTELVRDWDNRGHWYHVSREGKVYYDSHIEPAERKLYRLRESIRDINHEIRNFETLEHQANLDLQKKGWEVAERLLNIHELFLISKSYWERGYTQGSINNQDDFEVDEKETEIQMDESDGVFWNQNGARMLHLAYEWHAQHENGIEDRDQYPILLATNARRQSEVDRNTIMLDTYDMTMMIDGQKVELTPGTMDPDDELFWHTQVLPRTSDKPGKIIGLRFYPRKSIVMD